MTRRSERELEQAVDRLDGGDEDSELSNLLWASLKDFYDGPLSPGEQRLLADPEAHLSAGSLAALEDWGSDQ